MRWAVLLVACGMVCGVCVGRSQLSPPLSQASAEKFWERFRDGKTGDWESDLAIQIRNAEKEKSVLSGKLKASHQLSGVSFYLNVQLSDGKALKALLLFGKVPEIFVSVGGQPVQRLKEEDYLKPLAEDQGFFLSAWDVFMPFLKWKKVAYLEPSRVSGRPVERFFLSSENFLNGSIGVRVAIDAHFESLLKVDTYEKEVLWRSSAVRSFQKVKGKVFYKRWILDNRRTGERGEWEFHNPIFRTQDLRYFDPKTFLKME